MSKHMVRVIRDLYDKSQDYEIDFNEARLLLMEGRLFWDIKNNCYTHPRERNNYVGYRQTDRR